ncbi:MAG: T9SS type A sorting domain-containing protein [Candidatus Kapabacteria bacterium]|nr:T9SS type A sorting domain-containing protein [Candidatus Kapabacteria bacterium]
MIIRIFSLLILLSFASYSATYYVSLNGNDNNDGLSLENAFATPGFASKAMSNGDTLLILSGDYLMSVYYDDMITPPAGLNNRFTVIRGIGNTKPRLIGKGENGLGLLCAIDLGGNSNILVENLEITSLIDSPYSGGFRDGIENFASEDWEKISNIILSNILIHHIEETAINLSGNAENIIIKNCHLHHTGGTLISSAYHSAGSGWKNVLIDSCLLEYAGRYFRGKEQNSEWDRPDGIGIEISEGPFEIRNCVSQFNLGDGFDSKAHNTYIHHCVSANNFADGIKLWGDSARVENCLIYGIGGGNPESSPWVSLILECDRENYYAELTNLTIHDGSPRRHYLGTINYGLDNNSTVLIRNCLFQGASNRFYSSPNVKLILKNNIFGTTGESILLEAMGQEFDANSIKELGVGNFFADADFVNPTWGKIGNFHLKQTSPAIDKGILETGIPLTDLDYKPRPKMNGVDIGCYEYDPESDIDYVVLLGSKIEIYPNPASNFFNILSDVYISSVEILNLQGISQLKLNQEFYGQHSIDINELPNGFHIVKIKTKNDVIMKPLIKISN